MCPTFNLFGRSIGTYSLMSLIGFAACLIFLLIKRKKYRTDFDSILLLMLTAVAGLVVGGHIIFGLTNIKTIVGILTDINKISIIKKVKLIAYQFGGMVFYGGLIGMYLSIIIYSHFSKSNTLDERLDMLGQCVPLFHTFGRIGCFLGGCCYGIESKFGFVVHNNALVPELNGVRRFPVALTEAFINLLIFIALILLNKNDRYKNKIIYMYGLMYTPIRFALEFFRGDEIRGHILFLSTSQWISIILFLFCIFKLSNKKIKSRA